MTAESPLGTPLLTRIRSLYPDFRELTYYKALLNSEFSESQTMCAHLQDLARSIGCRGLREIQLAKLEEQVALGRVSPSDAQCLRETIEDELPGPNRPSHFDIRLQMFAGMPFSRDLLETVRPLPPAKQATAIFRSLLTDRGLLEITAAVGAIEEWYVPLAAMLEQAYLALGYSTGQVATYALHKSADVAHSESALAFVDKYSRPGDYPAILQAVRDGFRSVELYDDARYLAATDTSVTFRNYLATAE